MLRYEGRTAAFKPQQTYYWVPGTTVEPILASDDAEYYVIVFAQLKIGMKAGRRSAADASGDAELLPPGRLRLNNGRQIVEQTLKLYEDCKHRRIGAQERQLRFSELLLTMTRGSREWDDERLGVRSIEASVEYIHREYKRQIRLEELARLAGMTPTSYSRSFKRAMGMSPFEYLTSVRIRNSKRLMEEKSDSVAQIAELSGFGNETYFKRVFKSATGLTPAYYMKRSRLRIAVVSCLRYEDNLQMLGIRPVMTVNLLLGQHVPGAHGTMLEDRLRALEQSKPDLIVIDFRHRDYHNIIRAIAPVVVAEPTSDWRANHMRLAEWTETEKTAVAQFTQLDAKIRMASGQLRRTLGSQSFTFMRMIHGVIRIQGKVNHPLNELLYAQLELTPGSGVPVDQRISEYTLERLPPQETDLLYVYEHDSLPDGGKALQGFHTKVDAVPNWILMSWSPEGQRRIIDQLLSITQ